MELRCPDCASPEVRPSPRESLQAKLCGLCGAHFPRDSALVTVADAEAGIVAHELSRAFAGEVLAMEPWESDHLL